MSATDCARDFVAALSSQDFDRLGMLLAPAVQFHAVVPAEGSFREEATAEGTAKRFAMWFGEASPLELISSSVEELPETVRINYRFAAFEEDRWHVVEQYAYARVEDGKIAKLDLVCSGFQPVADHPVAV